MLTINENTIEQNAIDTLQSLGWRYVYGKTILAGNTHEWRERTSDVIFKPLLAQTIAKLNPNLPANEIENVVRLVCRSDNGDLAERNRQAYDWLKNGVSITYQQDGEERADVVRLIDFQTPSNNDFCVVNQLDIHGTKGKRIPDVIGYVNGLPLVVFELKNPFKENADIGKAYAQLQTYKDEIGDLFVFNQALVISDGVVARIGSLTADFNRFTPWRVIDEKDQSRQIAFENELEGLTTGIMTPKDLLDYVQNFVVYEKDSKNRVIKKIGAYHQFYGVNEAVDCTLHATAKNGDRKVGVFWHTQGSGKSLSMLFYAGKVLSRAELKNPTLVIVTDRNDLDGQLYATFCGGKDLLKQTPIQADGRDELRQALASRSAGGVIFTTIQKFGLLDGELAHPTLNERENIIVITDEAHRSQYGFKQKIDHKGQYKEGYAKHLRSALPNASFIGFTGTPIALDDKDTQEVFGKYVSIYDFEDAVADGATVPIIYEPRQISLGESSEFANAVQEAEALLDEDSPTFRLREKLHGVDSRLQQMAEDIVSHYEKRTEQQDGKAMVVVMSREICVKLYDKLIALRPDWHSDDVQKGAVKIVMTSTASDPAEWQRHNQDKKTLEKRFKDPDDPLKIVIVRDMWLTGFDAPCCNTMYIDKPMSGHNLMQAIARVNRVFRNKSTENGGLIVDYVGLTDELEKAIKQYTNASGKTQQVRDIGAVVDKLVEYITVIRGQFATPVDGKTVDVNAILKITEPPKLLTAILTSANHILALDRVNPNNDTDKQDKTPRKNAFLQAVRFAQKGFSLCGALKDVEPYKQELAFYDAVRATIIKNSTTTRTPTGDNDRLLQLALLMNKAVSSDGVVDLFDLLKKDRPNINLMSDEFLESIKNSPTKDLWLLAMERFLSSELKEKGGVNLATKKEFEERLKEAMNQYHNHNLSVLEIIEELISLAKEFEARQKRGEELGLNPAEMAFYDALVRNESAVREMGDEVLMKLAKDITDKLRKSVTIDWQYKDSVRAKMRTLIRIALRSYKYPPDLQAEAIEFVIQQAEAIAEDLVAA
ncbi:type I restriction endonuclease subunit R [Mannheimia sp. AT1]|uniref:Type I restriction enzyme endonuclease subunit n=1 Tax=Mannheimia cairinae TaxID=3025936 RepID=A0ABT5MLI0_9PAST|nr:type I restriction endonuclease subunit R [Mannheimia cairinae]MDD0823047.1 type I restriction endonuclease subunit R [Mannheimia cairinae]MDD0825928.1 type I restriction endonuclease subunit R [Mannheimia cairinae]